MFRFTQSLFILLALGSLVAPSYGLELVPHKAIYKTNIDKGIKISGTAIRELKKLKNGNWSYRFDVDSFAADIKESVTFEWMGEQIIPFEYHYSLSGMLIKDRYQDIKFDWINKKAFGRNHDKKDWQIDLQDKALDRLGYQLQLLMDAQRLSDADPTPMIDYQIVHRAKHRPSQFKLMGDETIDTSQGRMKTRKVIKNRASGKKRETHLWFSKEHPFLLIKMVQVEKDGERYEININAATSLGKKLF